MTYRCPECRSTDVKVTGPPIIIHYDEEGPVAFEYEDDPTSTIDDASPVECLDCQHSAFASDFKAE